MLPEETIFFDACRQGNLSSVQQIYNEHSHLVNTKDLKGFTPLIIAVYNNQPEIVQFLLDNGAKSDSQDASGNTALMGATFKGYPHLVQMLIEAGADVNQKNYQGAMALTFAATFGQLEIATILLKKGAAVFVNDVSGKNPLDHAMMQKNDAMVALLQQYLPPQTSATNAV